MFNYNFNCVGFVKISYNRVVEIIVYNSFVFIWFTVCGCEYIIV